MHLHVSEEEDVYNKYGSIKFPTNLTQKGKTLKIIKAKNGVGNKPGYFRYSTS